MPRTVACVVEGHGDVQALPLLVRRVAQEAEVFDLTILHPHRVPRNRLVAPGPSVGPDLERAMRLQGARAGASGLLIVMVDADDDDPEDVTALVEQTAPDLPCARIAVAVTRDYEAWFLAALPSLDGHPLIRNAAAWEGDPEAPRDAKGRLSERMTERYREVLHQPKLTVAMSLTEAAGAARFHAFRRHLLDWLGD